MKTAARLVLLALVFGCATAPVRPPVQPVHVVVVGTTDLHGWFAGHADKNAPPYGGLALFSGYLAALRAANPGHVVLVDSGDLFQGTLESNLFEGEPVVKGYNALGYNAAAVGNHEFDFGPVGPDSVPRTPDQDPLGALKKNAAAAHFPFLAANITDVATGQTPSWEKRYTIVPVDGAKIGIIGLATPDTPNVTTPQNVTTLNFGDPVAATITAAKELRAAGADAVIVIAHIGGKCTDMADVNDVASCDPNEPVMNYLSALPAGTIDGYLGGHTHQQMRQIMNGVPATQGLAYNKEFSTLDLWVDPAAHRVTKSELRPLTMICANVYTGSETCDPKRAPKGVTTLVPRTFEGRAIAPDAQLAATLQPYLDQVAAKKSEKLGITTSAAFTNKYQEESALGDLMTDALRDYYGADIAFINSGGLRAALRAGDLTYGDMFDVSPFDNYPAIVMLTGAQIAQVLQATSNGERGILQTSGVRYTIDQAKDMDKKAADRNRVVALTLDNGQPLDPNKLYKVVTLDFLTAGGDGWMAVMQSVPKDRVTVRLEDGPVREVFIPALRKRPMPLTPKIEGRITQLNGKPAPEH